VRAVANVCLLAYLYISLVLPHITWTGLSPPDRQQLTGPKHILYWAHLLLLVITNETTTTDSPGRRSIGTDASTGLPVDHTRPGSPLAVCLLGRYGIL